QLTLPNQATQRPRILDSEHVGQLSVVTVLRMIVQWQMVGNEVDVVIQQLLDPVFLHVTNSLVFTFPEVAVVDKDHVCVLFDCCVDQCLAGRHTGNKGHNLLAAFNLEAIRAVILEIFRLEPLIDFGKDLVSIGHTFQRPICNVFQIGTAQEAWEWCKVQDSPSKNRYKHIHVRFSPAIHGLRNFWKGCPAPRNQRCCAPIPRSTWILDYSASRPFISALFWSLVPIVIRRKSLIRGLLKCRTIMPCSRSFAAISAPSWPGWRAKTKFALDGSTSKPSVSNSLVTRSRSRITPLQESSNHCLSSNAATAPARASRSSG